MATTKSQLPMIRSLKTIARRKSNIYYYDIPVPEEVSERLKNKAASAKREKNRAVRALLRGQTKTLLASIALESIGIRLDENEASQVAAFKQVQATVIEAAGETSYYDLMRAWQRDQQSKAKALYAELENLELQVIAGESVDLAPYTRQLQN